VHAEPAAPREAEAGESGRVSPLPAPVD
jgi:hypothetical protein